MPTSRDPRKLIQLLKVKANANGTTPDEKAALEDKIKKLRDKYNVPEPTVKEAPFDYSKNKIQPMSEEEFTRYFHSTPSGVHTTIFATRSGKAFYITWLSEQMAQENPRGNEESWDLIDPNTDLY